MFTKVKIESMNLPLYMKEKVTIIFLNCKMKNCKTAVENGAYAKRKGKRGKRKGKRGKRMKKSAMLACAVLHNSVSSRLILPSEPSMAFSTS